MTNKTYHKGEIGKMVGFLVQKYELDVDEVKRELFLNFPTLLDKSTCPNCTASMEEYWYVMDATNALLLLKMAETVRHKIRKGMSFTHANMVHIGKEVGNEASYSMASRQTHCAKHGLIAKILNKDKTHDRNKGWLITARGFAFLRGEPVPKKVKVWRNEIQERCADMVTMGELLTGLKTPYPYDKHDWMEFAGPHQGALL